MHVGNWLTMPGMWLFWGAVLIAIALLFRYVGALIRERKVGDRSAEEIFEEWYARGEIDREELECKGACLRRRKAQSRPWSADTGN